LGKKRVVWAATEPLVYYVAESNITWVSLLHLPFITFLMPELHEMHCEKDSSRLFVLEDEEIKDLLKLVWQWRIEDETLVKEFFFSDFISGVAFINKVAKIAEQENYSPKFKLEQKKVEVILCTEEMGGLLKNDFIIAAKVDGLLKK